MNTSVRPGSLCALAVLVAVSGGACMSIEAEAPEIEIKQLDVRFVGVPAQLGVSEQKRTFSQQKQSFVQSHPALDLPGDLSADIHAVEVVVQAKAGIEDFSFLRAFRVTMQDEAKKQKVVELLRYTPSAQPSRSLVLAMPAQDPVNVIELWQSTSSVFSLEVEGTLPERDWVVDVTLSFAGRASWKY